MKGIARIAKLDLTISYQIPARYFSHRRNVSITYTISCMVDYTRNKRDSDSLRHDQLPARSLITRAPLIFLLSYRHYRASTVNVQDRSWKPLDPLAPSAAHHTRETVVDADRAIDASLRVTSLPRGRAIDDDYHYVSPLPPSREQKISKIDLETERGRRGSKDKNNCGGSER